MSRALLFAWRHFVHYRRRGSLLVAAIVLVFLLPLVLRLVLDDFARSLSERAASTPLVLGAKGSRYDLVLSSLYFRGRVPEPVTMRVVEELQDGGLADPIPVHLGHSARGFPIVGTTHDYYGWRALRFDAGAAPAFLGEAVLGASVARELGFGVGDSVLSDQGNLYELSLSYPLRLRVVGVLAETGTADDGAVFCDIKTAWILDGAGHGHVDAGEEDPERVMARDEESAVLGAATFEYAQVDVQNLDAFHFHGESAERPVAAVFCLPHDARGATILKARYGVAGAEQLLVPSEVVDELLALVFRVQRFFDVHALLVGVAMALLFALVFLLSLRLRAAEFETLQRIGFSRATIVRLVAAEWALLLLFGAVLVVALGLVLSRLLSEHGVHLLMLGGWA